MKYKDVKNAGNGSAAPKSSDYTGNSTREIRNKKVADEIDIQNIDVFELI